MCHLILGEHGHSIESNRTTCGSPTSNRGVMIYAYINVCTREIDLFFSICNLIGGGRMCGERMLIGDNDKK